MAALQAALAERDGCVAELTARLEPLEVDVALLMADRGRDAAAVEAPEEAAGSDTAAGHGVDQVCACVCVLEKQHNEARPDGAPELCVSVSVCVCVCVCVRVRVRVRACVRA